MNKTRICLLPKEVSSWDLTADELVNKYLLFESNEEINIGEPFKYKEKCYSVGCTMPKDRIAIAREFTEKNGKAINFEGEITCPYCGRIDCDSYEKGDSEDKEICGICGSEFSWIREVEVTYSSQPVKKFEIKVIKS